MRIRNAFIAGSAAVVLLVASGASAEDRWFVAGNVDSVNEDERTIDLDGNRLHLGARAVIKLAGGVTGTWDDIVARDGEHATALVRTGYRAGDEVISIVLEDEVEDGEE